MDKIETALTATEDNAAAIRALSNKLRDHIGNVGQVSGEFKIDSATFIAGVQVPANNLVSFGQIKSDGNVCAIVAFDSTSKRVIVYNNRSLGQVLSPAIVRLPKGDSEFLVTSVLSATALLFYMHP